MTRRRLLLGAGTVALVLSVLVVSPLPPNVAVRLSSLPVALPILGGTALVAALLGAAVLLGSTGSAPPRPTNRATGNSAVSPGFTRVVGRDLDAAVESLAADGDSVHGHGLYGSRSHLQRELRTLAVEALVDRGHDRETAERLVETGEWTDDPRAAAFLGRDAPPVPLRLRIHDWATGEGEREAAERAVEAVAELSGVDR